MRLAKESGFGGKEIAAKGCLNICVTEIFGGLLFVRIKSANLHEVTLVEMTLEDQLIDELPRNSLATKLIVAMHRTSD